MWRQAGARGSSYLLRRSSVLALIKLRAYQNRSAPAPPFQAVPELFLKLFCAR
jgi:hypothetical protein